jgi:hypothetical protein
MEGHNDWRQLGHESPILGLILTLYRMEQPVRDIVGLQLQMLLSPDHACPKEKSSFQSHN